MNSNEYIIRNQPMICASAEAENKKYHRIIRGNKTWLYTDLPDASSHIYYHDAFSNDKSGFAGRTITFPLVNGSEVKLEAPWHIGPEGLYKKTGVDLRDKYLQQVVIASSMERRKFSGKYGTVTLSVLTGIFHIDNEPVIGSFNRAKEIAKGIANSIGRPVRCYVHTIGGSCLSLEKPAEEIRLC